MMLKNQRRRTSTATRSLNTRQLQPFLVGHKLTIPFHNPAVARHFPPFETLCSPELILTTLIDQLPYHGLAKSLPPIKSWFLSWRRLLASLVKPLARVLGGLQKRQARSGLLLAVADVVQDAAGKQDGLLLHQAPQLHKLLSHLASDQPTKKCVHFLGHH